MSRGPSSPAVITPGPGDLGTAYAMAGIDKRVDILEGQYDVMGNQFTLTRGIYQSTAGGGNPQNYYPGVVSDSSGIDSYNSGGVNVMDISAQTGTLTINTSTGATALQLDVTGLQVDAGSGGASQLGNQPWIITWLTPGGVPVGAVTSIYNVTSLSPPEDLMAVGCQPSTSGNQSTTSTNAADAGGSVHAAVFANYRSDTGFAKAGASAGSYNITIIDTNGNTFLNSLSLNGSFNPSGINSSGDIFASNGSGQSGAVYSVGAVGANSGFSGNPSNQQMQLRANYGSLPGFSGNTYPTVLSTFTAMYFAVDGVYCAYMQATGVLQQPSGRALKQHFRELDTTEVLNRISLLPVQEYEFKSTPGIKSVGPTAEDFYREFRLGQFRPRKEDRTRPHHEPMLAASDVAGVALLGVKGLVGRVKDLEHQLREMEHRLFLQEVR